MERDESTEHAQKKVITEILDPIVPKGPCEVGWKDSLRSSQSVFQQHERLKKGKQMCQTTSNLFGNFNPSNDNNQSLRDVLAYSRNNLLTATESTNNVNSSFISSLDKLYKVQESRGKLSHVTQVNDNKAQKMSNFV